MTWIPNLEVYLQRWCWLVLGVCFLLRLSIGTRRSRKIFVTHIVVLPNYQCFRISRRTSLCIEKFLKNLGSSPFAKKHVRIVLATKALEGLTLKTKPSVLRGAAHCIVRWTRSLTHPFPSLKRNLLKILAALVRQRNTCTRTCLLSFGSETHELCVGHLRPKRSLVQTLKTDPSISR